MIENRFGLVGIAGIVLGVGELIGASLCIIIERGKKSKRGYLMIIGMATHVIAYYLWY